MATNRFALLAHIVSASVVNVGPQHPHGYMYIVEAQLPGVQELVQEGNVTAFPQNVQNGQFPVIPTGQGVQEAKLGEQQQQAPAFPPAAGAAPAVGQSAGHTGVVIEDNVPMPASAPRGFARSAEGSAVDRFRFADMKVGQSFHLPPSTDPEKPIHRTFSSTVSQANAKLFPARFRVVAVDQTDPRGHGARVYREPDHVGERPTRAPRKRKNAAGATAEQQGYPAPTQGQGQGGGFPTSGGFPAPAGFPAPQAAPQAPGGFDQGGGFPGFPAPAGGPGGFPG